MVDACRYEIYCVHVTEETDSDYDAQRQFRAPKDEWDPFEPATRVIYPTGRGPRGRVIREFIRWYMRRPGAKLPRRPPAGPWSVPPGPESD